MLFAEVVDVSRAVGGTRSRKAKVEALAGLLRALAPGEVEPAAAWLAGTPRQGRLGIGWRTLLMLDPASGSSVAALDAPAAAEPTLDVCAVDTALAELGTSSGAGSARRRAELLAELFGAATEDEQRFLFRLLTGELRHGALEGVLTEAVAAASGVAPELVRRGLMLSGSLPVVARAALASPASSLDEAVAELSQDGGGSTEDPLAGSSISTEDPLAGSSIIVEYKLDGVDLLDAPLRDRLAALDRVAGEHRMPGLIDATAEQAAALLDQALAAGHEGVMVKSLDAPYAAGRRGKSWRKVKPAHTLDLVVLAAEWGYGRRTGSLSNIHLGARDPDGGEPIMVGKTFKGMTDELLAWQTEQFSARALSDDGHVVVLPPEFVVEIELDGVQSSTRYPSESGIFPARVGDSTRASRALPPTVPITAPDVT